jgi:hypothetical protein
MKAEYSYNFDKIVEHGNMIIFWHVKIGLLYFHYSSNEYWQCQSIHDFTAGFSQYFDKIIGHGDAQIKEVCFIFTTLVISIGSVNHYTIALLISDSISIYVISGRDLIAFVLWEPSPSDWYHGWPLDYPGCISLSHSGPPQSAHKVRIL